MSIHLETEYVTVSCGHDGCHQIFAMSRAFYDETKRTGCSWYCPSGHCRVWRTGKSDEQKLREAEARETHLKDQLAAATRNEEAARSELLRIRSRIAAGVCPCCRRTFQNVSRHMETQHPEFAVPADAHRPTTYRCSCGSRFTTFRGLRVHQGLMRPDDWDAPGKSRTATWGGAHLTEVSK